MKQTESRPAPLSMTLIAIVVLLVVLLGPPPGASEEADDGWATYLEATFVLAGLTREVPRADELFHAALMTKYGPCGERYWAKNSHLHDRGT